MLIQEPLSSLVSTVDGEVLTRLARINTPISLAALSRLVPNRSYHGVRNSLIRLVSEGIVTELASGQAKLYLLNREHLAADAILQMVNARERLLERIRSLVSTWKPAPRFVVLFGSAARGDMTTESDIDVLVIFEDDADKIQSEYLELLSSSIELWTGNSAEVIDYSVGDVRGRYQKVDLLQNVEHEGIFAVGDRVRFKRMVIVQ